MNYIDLIVEEYAKDGRKPVVFQAGAMDGVRFDDLRPYIIKHRLSGLLVEPIPRLFEILKKTYAGHPGLTLERVAIALAKGHCRMKTVDAAAAAAAGVAVPDCVEGLSTFYDDRNVLGPKHSGHAKAIIDPGLDKFVAEVVVPCTPLLPLFDRHLPDGVDIVQLDTEGFDYDIIRQLDLEEYNPRLIRYKHTTMPAGIKSLLHRKLRSAGFALTETQSHVTATRTSGRHPVAEMVVAVGDAQPETHPSAADAHVCHGTMDSFARWGDGLYETTCVTSREATLPDCAVGIFHQLWAIHRRRPHLALLYIGGGGACRRRLPGLGGLKTPMRSLFGGNFEVVFVPPMTPDETWARWLSKRQPGDQMVFPSGGVIPVAFPPAIVGGWEVATAPRPPAADIVCPFVVASPSRAAGMRPHFLQKLNASWCHDIIVLTSTP